jgi:hypothetical protein
MRSRENYDIPKRTVGGASQMANISCGKTSVAARMPSDGRVKEGERETRAA